MPQWQKLRKSWLRTVRIRGYISVFKILRTHVIQAAVVQPQINKFKDSFGGGGGGGATPKKIGYGCAACFPKPLPYL